MKWVEFLQDVNGKLSSKRLAFFVALIVSSYIMVHITFTGDISEGFIGIFTGAFALVGGASVLEKK